MCQNMSDVFNIARMMLVLVATFFSLPLYTWLIANCAIYLIITITCVICVFFCSLCYSLSLTRATTNQIAFVEALIRCITDRTKQRSVRDVEIPFGVLKCIKEHRDSLDMILCYLMIGLCGYIPFCFWVVLAAHFTWMCGVAVVAFLFIVYVVVFRFQFKVVGYLLAGVVLVALPLLGYHFL